MRTEYKSITHNIIRYCIMLCSSMHPMKMLICWLTKHIACKYRTCLNAIQFKVLGNFIASKWYTSFDREWKSKPIGKHSFVLFGKNKKIFILFKKFIQFCKTFLSSPGEIFEP